MKAIGIIVTLAAVAGAAVAAIKFAPVIKEKMAAKKAAKEAEDACCDCECECECECDCDEAAEENVAE